MKQVAIGVPRSGTHFLSTLLGWHHERYYRPGKRPPGFEYEPEVSWCAAPFVNPDDTLIYHIVRHPLKVISSNIYRGWLNSENAFGRFAHQWTSTWDYWDFYCTWFELCANKAHVTIKLETIEHLGNPTNQFGKVDQLTWDDIPEKCYDEIRRISREFGYDL